MKIKKALPTPLREAIISRKTGDLTTVRNAAIDFVSDRLMVESFSREVEGVVEVEKPVALECALDAYADNVTVTNTNKDGLVVNADTDVKPFRALPIDLRTSILALKKEVEVQVEEGVATVDTPVVPPTPAGAEDEDFGDDLEAMFTQRPEDIELIDEYAKDFTVKAGVDEKAAYGYALDAYLEGVSEFWGQVETIQEEDAEEIAEEEEEEEAVLPEMGAATNEEDVDASAVVAKRHSLANNMTESLCEILNPKEDAMEEDNEEDKRAAVASSVAGSLCQLLTNTAMANVSAMQGTEVEEKVEEIVQSMGDNIAKLIKSCKKSAKKGASTEETETVAADIAKDLTNLFHLKEEVAPKSAKKNTSKRMSLAADMADSLVGLFASPRAPMAAGRKTKEARRASLAADMGSSLSVLFGESEGEETVQAMNDCLEKLMDGDKAAPEVVASSLVDLIQTTTNVVLEDEKAIKKKKAKGRRTSMKRMSLPGDVGESLNSMFGYGGAEEEETEEIEGVDAEKEVDEVAEFLNNVEAVAQEVSAAKVEVVEEVEEVE
mmetsp:Transcript_7195/g.14571  ORF Transcript_7195/g.14571 Transcript_7195/m.14571 type:complete len:549 (+) Transcript_7195:112-1758(+)